ncbi:beta-alanine synthase [Aspergillus sclerotioniger CBS 115572]|uniref:Beta-alanine synthase n=1 Tax=Aspergillus sclerotioniger CBS 115572 TaxID=1450535 RepID=A0A317X754_9EURO|nr:beta-alanine synthase [Aspergillus sclerotioniger CBS 115572]PWY94423.1 beta-alanine synthase [Aspergillus sclerotioniger CBS 115572]
MAFISYRSPLAARVPGLLLKQTRRLSVEPAFTPLRRAFSVTSNHTMLSTDLTEAEVSALRANKERLANDLHHSCQWGYGIRWGDGHTDTGMQRLALSQEDKQVRDWFLETTKALKCEITVDEMGNIFAVRPGRRTDVPATFIGSHLDTQPTGGRYDGILGVLSGIEVLKVIDEMGLETEGGIGVVNWTNEEGARFPISMVSSGVWAECIPLSRAHELKEVPTVASLPTAASAPESMKSALEKINYLGSVPCSYKQTPMAAHFELHIEQGPHLVSAGQHVGVVTAVQAYRWFHLTIFGRDTHTGTTAFEHRADALYAFARMMVRAREVASSHGCLASVGIVEAKPGSVNTVPGLVSFSLDIRGPESELVQVVEEQLRKDFDSIAAEEGKGIGKPCRVEWRLDFDSPAVKFHPDCIDCVQQSAEAVVADVNAAEPKSLTRTIMSGAGHDSVFTSKRVPTSMIFVPCKDGLSHHPEEFCSADDCATGTSVILQAVIRYDRKRFAK